MVEHSAYVGLDIQKETIAVAVALPGRDNPMYRDEIHNKASSLRRLVVVRRVDCAPSGDKLLKWFDIRGSNLHAEQHRIIEIPEL